MMLYPLYRAVQKLWLNRKTYLFLLIEFVLGTTVVLCGYLSGRAATYRLEAYEMQSRKTVYPFSIMAAMVSMLP